ncbi:MAG: ABC transporter permease subunit [Chloroflexota bacterium]
MNIFLRELKANFKSLLIWIGIAILFSWIGFSKFSAYYENPELLAILDGLPPGLLAAFNMNAFNLTTLSGFFGVMFAYFGLMLSISAAMWGSDIISKEERDKTVEFSLTLPVTRFKLIVAKAAAAVVNSIALLLVTWGALYSASQQYEPTSEFYDFVSLGMLALFIMQMIFLAIGILLGCAMKQHKRSSSAAVSVLLGTYFISIVSGFYEDLEFLNYLSPFKYFDAGTMFRESRLEPEFLWISAGIVVAAMVAAYLSYSRRDLYI